MKNNILMAWVLAVVACTHVSCRKDTQSVGLNTGDNTLNMIEIDTFTIITRTVKEDSIQSHNLTYNLLGSVNDAVFGKSAAHLYTHFLIPSSNFTFGATPTLDSIVLTIKLLTSTSYNGDVNSNLNLKVFELNERMSKDSTYYSDKSFAFLPSQIGSYNARVNMADSVSMIENGISIKYAPHLRIVLDKATFGNKLLNASAANLATNDAFTDFIKGIYIQADGAAQAVGEGIIPYVDLKNAISGLTVYYNGTQKAVFAVTATGARVNRFEHDYAAAPLITAQLASSTGNFDETYVQTMAGLKTKIEIPGLVNLDGNYAVVNARMIFNYDNSLVTPGFASFSRTILTKPNALGVNDFVLDQLLEPDFYGGLEDKTNNSYTYNISREIQETLTLYRNTGTNNNRGFFLIAPADNPVSASHLRIDTRKNNPRGIKFRLSLVKTF